MNGHRFTFYKIRNAALAGWPVPGLLSPAVALPASDPQGVQLSQLARLRAESHSLMAETHGSSLGFALMVFST